MAELRQRYADWHDRRTPSLSPDECERLRLLWRDHGRHWPVYGQILFLIQPDVEQALGEAECGRLIRHLRKQHQLLLHSAPSYAWLDAWGQLKTELPRAESAKDGGKRKHAVRLRRRRAQTNRVGAQTRPPGRWTPPQCFEFECKCDDRPPDPFAKADFNEELRSPSAVIIGQIGMRRVTERKWYGRESVPGTETVVRGKRKKKKPAGWEGA
jgi:hypothetical protein